MFLPLNQSTWMPLCGSSLLKDRHPEPLAAGCFLLLASHWSSRPILADFSPHWQRHGFAALHTDSVLCASYRQVVQQSDAADASAWMVPVWLRPRSTPLRLCAPCNVQLRFHLPTGARLLQGGPHKASVALLRLRRGSRNAPISKTSENASETKLHHLAKPTFFNMQKSRWFTCTLPLLFSPGTGCQGPKLESLAKKSGWFRNCVFARLYAYAFAHIALTVEDTWYEFE